MRWSPGRFFRDEHGRVVIAQAPNLPITAWAAFALAAWLADGAWAGTFAFLRDAALLTWAYLEIRCGDSPFRRVLGGAVLVVLLVSRMP